MSNALNQLRQAVAFLQAGKLAEAIRLSQTILWAEPKNFDALHIMALASYHALVTQEPEYRQEDKLVFLEVAKTKVRLVGRERVPTVDRLASSYSSRSLDLTRRPGSRCARIPVHLPEHRRH